MIDLSIIIPVHNESTNLGILNNELSLVLNQLNITYEIIFIDDGSTDNSFYILNKIKEKNSKIKIVKFISNYGQSSAIAAGVEIATGKDVITMDSDLQHDPRDIPRLLRKLNENYHVVCGWRPNRNKVEFTKSFFSKISNFLINRITKLRLHDSTGGMRAFKKEVIENIETYGEMHRYLPILAAWKGYKITEIPINLRKRKYGRSKYGITRIFRGFLDLLTVKFLVSYSTRPLHIFGSLGLSLGALGFLGSLYLTIRKLFFNIGITSNQPLFLLFLLLMILGTIFLCFGFIADMISLDTISSGKRKTYIIDKVIK
ncbi:MAG: glycosyltransferase family 2 protein [Nanoarchaeota archaeon]